MDIFRVTFFGHREVWNIRELEAKLIPILKNVMDTHTYIEFYIGRNGEFDEFVASIIKRLKKEREMSYNILILVLPYTVKDMEYYEKYYDEMIIPESIGKAHYKNAISLRNRWMVDQTDLVIVNVERQSGGAYTAMRYAEKQNKQVINLNELEEE